MTKALLLIDLQNDYFPGGSYPLWNTDPVVENLERAIARASETGVTIVHVQHVADASQGIAPFFNEGTEGVEIHARIRDAAPDAPIVKKTFADSFERTKLQEILAERSVTEILVAGMMTQNCVTHTAISRAAEPYTVTVLTDCCTTVDEMLHQIALHALSPRVDLCTHRDAL